jgi:hypothetical protein
MTLDRSSGGNFKISIPFLLYIKMTQVVSDSTLLFFGKREKKTPEMERGNGRVDFYIFLERRKDRGPVIRTYSTYSTQEEKMSFDISCGYKYTHVL